MQKIIIGSSHVTRWRWELKNGSIPCNNNTEYWGRMGLPIFSDSLSKKMEQAYKRENQIVLIVPDFRFGNSVVLDNKFIKHNEVLLNDAHNRLDKKFISCSNDSFLFENSIRMLKSYADRFSGEERFKLIFWCLFRREISNRQKGKFDVDGLYSHPLWNLSEVENLFSENVISLESLLNSSNVNSYFIDQQGHPTLKGYSLIYNAIKYNSFIEAENYLDRVYGGVSDILFPD